MAASLKGKVVIVSGASRRLGRCYAMALGRAGFTVVALARTMGDDPTRMGTLREVEASGRALGYDIYSMRCDLNDEASIDRVVTETIERFGGIDGLVNNAVYTSGRNDPLTIPRDMWDEAMQINVRAPYALITKAYASMAARGGGSIVNITSLAAQPTGKGGGAHLGLVLYGASKAALNRLTSWFAAEFEGDNIAVNAISPGDVSVFMRLVNGIGAEEGGLEQVDGAQLDEAFWGDPVVWLASARSGDMTGKIVHTYSFGESWGDRNGPEPAWSSEILKILGRDNVAKG
jgi:NAD(P)-dependent dehydrogenase (short-subunit alcohol dehydrogenase family)